METIQFEQTSSVTLIKKNLPMHIVVKYYYHANIEVVHVASVSTVGFDDTTSMVCKH